MMGALLEQNRSDIGLPISSSLHYGSRMDNAGHPKRNGLEGLDLFYAEVDAAVGRLCESAPWRLQCRPGCPGCCVDGITVFEVEADQIRRHHGDLLESGTAHPEGVCAFLDDAGACRIYEHRPYVCRTQGLPLRWIVGDPEGEWVEMRDICPENEVDCDLLRLEPEDCWLIGPFEERLRALQMALYEGSLERRLLRQLFLTR